MENVSYILLVCRSVILCDPQLLPGRSSTPYPSVGEFYLESCFVCVCINCVRSRPESDFGRVPF